MEWSARGYLELKGPRCQGDIDRARRAAETARRGGHTVSVVPDDDEEEEEEEEVQYTHIHTYTYLYKPTRNMW